MNKWRVAFNKHADKRILALPKDERERLLRAIYTLGDDPLGVHLDVKQLQGRPERRLRVGRWRVLYRLKHEIITVLVVGVDTRGDAYK